MRTRTRGERAALHAALFGGACAAAGCASLLGDFSTSPDVGNADAGHDAPTVGDGPVADQGGPEAGGSDAPVDTAMEGSGDDGGAIDADAGDGAPGPLDCTTWVYSSPIVLETLSTGNRQVQGALSIYPVVTGNGTNIRIVAGKNGPTQAFSVYTLDRTMSPPAVATLVAPTYFQSSVAALHRGPGSAATYTVVLGSVRTSASVSAAYEAWVLQDSLPGSGPLPTPFVVYQLASGQATPIGLRLLPLAANEEFVAIEQSVAGTPVTFTLGAGIATQGTPITSLAPIASSIHSADLSNTQQFNDSVNNQIYVYAQNDISSPGLSAWSLPNTAPPDAAAPTKRAVGALSASIQSIAENTSAPAADIAYIEANINGGVINGETFRAGTIPYAGASPDLDTWVSTDLPAARTYNGVGTLDCPVGVTSGSRWGQDNILFLGPGLRSAADGGVNPGLALLWVNSAGTIRSEERGPNRLLTSINDFSGVAATPLSIGAQGKNARWAVAWVETKTDDAGSYDVISYNELTCQ